jgi:tetratricopeptide (TPR) repeat protein
MKRRERRVAGRKPEEASNVVGAGTAATLYEAGLGHLRAGRHLDAQLCSQQALAMDANHAGALHLMGLLSLHAQQYDHALEWFSRAIRRDPRPEYLLSLGLILQQQGRREEALKAFDKAVQLKPDDATLWTKLGDVLADLDRSNEALLSFRHALELSPRNWSAMYNSGHVLYRLERPEEALRHFDLCDELQPNHAATLQIRAMCLYGLKRLDEALAGMRRAQALDPTNAGIYNNVGIILQTLGRDEEALEWFDQAVRLRFDYSDALHGKAVSLTRIRRFQEAFTIYDGLKTADPNDAVAELGVAHLHLLIGNFEAGWAGREVRWKDPSLSGGYPKLPQPMWLGNGTLEGKTILICADEGLGDTIQFVRYVPMVAERGARIVLAVQDPLHLFLSDLPGVSQCLSASATVTNPLPAFDVHCPIMSLPLAFGTTLDTIPAPRSYLPRPAKARVQVWEDRLGPHDRLRVGMVWSGNPAHKNDRNRSIPLRTFSPILDADATFVSLQKEPRPDDRAVLLERTDVVDLTSHLTDFVETAALVSCLDLVITVDTSVAHLAGALGCPTWILLPYTPDYRWLLDCDDSPWYPSVRLFRQTTAGDYAEVLGRVRAELIARISSWFTEADIPPRK